MNRNLFIVVTFLWIVSVVSSEAQRFISVYGKVVDEKEQAVGYAMIHVEGQVAYGMSGADGSYRVSCERKDSIRLICSLIGYRTRKFVVIPSGDSVRMDLKLISKSNTLGEVSVTSIRRQTDQMQQVGVHHTKSLPSTTGNAVEELVKTQMGVSSHNEMSSQYNVRGGSYDENCVYLNGIELYRPLLVRSGEQEGLSVINSNMVSDIRFSAGGFAARYGDRMSSVLDITYKRPEKWEASLSASFW